MNNLYLGDCLDVMPNLPDKSIDMIICDLPYGITAQEWDKNLNMVKLWAEYERLRKPNCCVLLFSCQPFTTQLIYSNSKNYRYNWYWKKNTGTNFLHAKSMPIRKIEEINVFYKGKYNPQMSEGHVPTNSGKGRNTGNIYHGKSIVDYKGGSTTRYPTNILEYKSVNNYKRKHPSEKPVDLLEYLILTYSNVGDTILDNCMGVGSSGIACKNNNRNFIGIEKEEKYFHIAQERLF